MDFFKYDIWCICLENNHERYISSLNEFKKVGIGNRVRYYRPKKDPRGGKYGVWKSHLYCMRQSVKRDQPYVLIFEDDVQFTEDWKSQMPSVQEFLQTEPDWSVMRLGGVVMSYQDESSIKCIWRAKSVCLHAYIINTKFIKQLLQVDTDKIDLPIDNYISDIQDKDYILVSPVCYQKGGFKSDNNWNYGLEKITQSLMYEHWQHYNNKLKWHIRFLPAYLQEKIQIAWLVYAYVLISKNICLSAVIIIVIVTIILYIVSRKYKAA